MARETLRLAVIARAAPPGPGAAPVLRPHAVMAEIPPLAPGTVMSDHGGVRLVYLGDHAVTLYETEAEHYRDNLTQARPCVWVAMSGAEVRTVTVDPYEGEALASDPERVAEALAMPPALARRLAAFIAAAPPAPAFQKRKRRPAPDPDARAPRVLRQDEKWDRR